MDKKATPSRCVAPIAAPPKRRHAMMAMATAIVVAVVVTAVAADIAAAEAADMTALNAR